MISDPIILDPPGLTPLECWRKYGPTDPGIVHCPACRDRYWAWGKSQQCKTCGFIYPTDAWAMYSWGAQAGRKGSGFKHEERLQHPYYRYGFEHPLEVKYENSWQDWEEYHRIDWRAAVGDWRAENAALDAGAQEVRAR